MQENFLSELNPNQKIATVSTEGPVMIIAGAGSGKTRVLTYRIAYLITLGVDPFNILALTFTNKAAREMKDRIGKLVGEGRAKSLWMGTFHSIFAKILRFEAEKLGYPKNFSIYDTDDSKSAIKEVLKLLNLDDKIYKPSLVLNRISSAKNNLIGWKQYQQNTTIQSEDRSAQKPMLGQIYEAYQKKLFRAGAMDFDDLLFNTNILLRNFPDVLFKYQEKFRYILVDEYQDTNFSQYVIIKQLAARYENICVVGDDAQSIYAFRGANIQNILNFERDYPEVKKYFLEQNYRSTQTIVNAANSVISKNKDQFEKNVWTENPKGEKIKIIRAHTDNEEGVKVAGMIFQTKMQNQCLNKDFAILYRTNAQSRSFEEALRKLNIPYRIYGGISFYQRKEIKDLLAYFRMAINPHDDESLKRIINYPARGIGQSTLDKLSVAATDNNVSLWTVIENIREFGLDISNGIIGKLNDFVALIKTYQHLALEKDAYDTANHIATSSGLLRDLFNDKTPEGVARHENIQELLNGIKDFSENARSVQEELLKEDILNAQMDAAQSLFAGTDKNLRTLDEFMQEITLLTDVDKKEEEDKDADVVTLMTIHAAKGLEFPYVHIVGLEENLFPSQMSLQSRSDLEEERRLFYVALTRAEKHAVLSFSQTRYRYGNLIYCEPSRFIDELDPDFVDFPEEPTTNTFADDLFDRMKHSLNPTKKEIAFNKTSSPSGKKLIQINKPSVAQKPIDFEAIKKIKAGSLVRHDKFGKGQVIALEGSFPNIKATIHFENAGQKQVLLKFARLELLD